MTRAEAICRSKKGWSTQTRAKVHALGVMNCPNPEYRSTVPIYVYCCQICGLWHLTGIAPEEWRRREKEAEACEANGKTVSRPPP